MDAYLTEVTDIDTDILLVLIGCTAIMALFGLFFLFQLMRFLSERLLSPQVSEIYQKIVGSDSYWLKIASLLAFFDLALLVLPLPKWINVIEIPLSVVISVSFIWLGFRIFSQVFDNFLLDAALQRGRKLTGEFLILGKLFANFTIVLVIVFIFAQTHKINIFGLVASLGIGGLAVAFASQKILEQVLGGIVLYLDRPFVIDDYIHLPDGTFGRVESIGWRSTKIRTSGKGSLVIVPNSVLTQVNIENLTGAKKVISLIYLTFYRTIPDEEKALIRQIILESTKDIFGIDPRNTEVIFKNLVAENNQKITQAQVNFFILGSGEVSMDLRRQLLDAANQSITKQLKEYSIAFDLEERTINVDSPITI
ncbi:mechanosensitive ion channel family protein [Myxosarcina sp. GI1]|uniref:mechanosensitive ion channel family protein n=1 Tax=Myxosarcina sp. GI1 TaxID=1541065 RepID=UPI0005626613|nr:mechanosensitive ion channel domain-containing protein [Myxosarcina sp. GI1]